jgi:rod shape-determining protein MreD
MSPRVALRVFLVAFLVLLLQSTAILSFHFWGVHPDLLWLLPITAALIAGPDTGALVGFWAGLAFDLFLPTPFGLSALVGCMLGYLVGLISVAVDKRAVWPKLVAAIFGSVGADMLFAVLGAVFGQEQMVRINFVALLGVIAISSAIFVIPVNRLMRWALTPDGTRRSLVSAHTAEGAPW